MIDQHWDFGSEADNKRMVTALVEDLESKLRLIFEKYRGLQEITAFLGVTRNPITQEPFKGLTIMVLESTSDFQLGMNERDKDKFTSIVEKAAHLSNAIMVAFVSEVWTIQPKNPEEALECEKYIKDHDSLEECPHRQEALMIHLEHSRLTPRHQIWTAPIEETKESRTFGKFEFQDLPGMQTRFNCLLPKFEDPKPNPASVN
jgi:hypothetical protein